MRTTYRSDRRLTTYLQPTYLSQQVQPVAPLVEYLNYLCHHGPASRVGVAHDYLATSKYIWQQFKFLYESSAAACSTKGASPHRLFPQFGQPRRT